jgi:hypothetical protein
MWYCLIKCVTTSKRQDSSCSIETADHISQMSKRGAILVDYFVLKLLIVYSKDCSAKPKKAGRTISSESLRFGTGQARSGSDIPQRVIATTPQPSSFRTVSQTTTPWQESPIPSRNWYSVMHRMGSSDTSYNF